MTFGDCLRRAIKSRGLTQKSFAELSGFSMGYINQICQDRKKPIFDTIEAFCETLSMSLSDFFAPMSADSQNDVPFQLLGNEKRHIQAMRSLSRRERDAIYDMVDTLSRRDLINDEPRKQMVSGLPVLGAAAAGSPLYDVMDEEETVPVPSRFLDSERFYIVQARGDSMFPDISNGDYVVVQKNAMPHTGEVACVSIDGLEDREYTIKRFYPQGETIELCSINEEYEPMVFSADDIQSAERVVHVISSSEL